MSPNGRRILSPRGGPVQLGALVACDIPNDKLHDAMAEAKLIPVSLVWRWQNGDGDVTLPVRAITPQEAVALINSHLATGTLEFGFRPKGAQGPLLTM